MLGTFGKRSVASLGGLLLRTGLFILIAWATSIGSGVAADPPSANKPALSAADRKKLLTERDRYNNESLDLEAQGKYAEAIAVAQKMLALERRVLGAESGEVVASVCCIARYHVACNDFAAARKALGDELSVLLKQLGDGDWRVCDVRLALRDADARARFTPQERRELVEADQAMSRASVLDSKAQADKAIPLVKRALELRQRILGREHLQTATCVFEFGYLCERTRKYEEAEPYFREALAIQRKILPKDHPDIALSLEDLGAKQWFFHDYGSARKSFEEALAMRRKALGHDHLDIARSLYNVGLSHRHFREYTLARKCHEEELAIYRALLPEDDARIAKSLEAQEDVDVDLHDYASARKRLEQALAIRRKSSTKDDVQIAVDLYDLGFVQKSLRDYAAARKSYAEALAIRRKVLPREAPGIVHSIQALASVYEYMNKVKEAEPLRREVLEIRERVLGKEHPDTADALLDLSVFSCFPSGKLTEGASLAERALAIRKKVLGKEHHQTIETLEWLGILYANLGNNVESERCLREAAEINKRIHGGKDPVTASALWLQGAVYVRNSRYAEAMDCLQKALATDQNLLGKTDPETALHFALLGALYLGIGDLEQSEQWYSRALKISDSVGAVTEPAQQLAEIQSLGGLALVYMATNRDAAAERLLSRAVAISERSDFPADGLTSALFDSLGLLYHSRGRFTEAATAYQRALTLRQRALGNENPITAMTYNNLGWLYTHMQEYAKAEQLLQRALHVRISILGKEHPDTGDSLSTLAELCARKGDYAQAEPLQRRALAISQRLLVDTFSVLSEREQLAFEARLRCDLDAYLSVAGTAEYLASAGPKAVSEADVYRFILLAKGVVTAQQSFIRVKLRRRDLTDLFKQLDEDCRQLKSLRFSPPEKPEEREVWRSEINRLEQQRTGDQQKLAAQSGEFHKLEESLQADAKSVESLQKALPPKSALVDVIEYDHSRPPAQKNGWPQRERRLAAFIVRRDAMVKRIDLGAADEIRKTIDDWRRIAVEPELPITIDDSKQLESLRSNIWDKLEPHLMGVETLLVSPDGPLCRFPLAALPGTKPDTYLIQERPLTIVVIPVPQLLLQLVTSASDVQGRTSGQSKTESMLLVGDVAYDGPPGLSRGLGRSTTRAASGKRLFHFPKLESTRAEILTINNSFEDRFKKEGGVTRLLKKDEATETEFRRQAPNYRWLHLATHGFFAPPELRSALNSYSSERRLAALGYHQAVEGLDPALLSGIAFAGANREPKPGQDDGILTALEVSELDLSGVEMAVLSACQTGLGETAGGEGLLGLQRAFQVAGARSVLASLWEVPDLATSLLMQRFYENLWDKKMSKAKALREAQIWMLKEGAARGLDLKEGAPRQPGSGRLPAKYWAAFVLSGDWR